jgi:hypothetical protein
MDTQAVAFWLPAKWCDRRPLSLVRVNNNDARDCEERLARPIDYLRDYRGQGGTFNFGNVRKYVFQFHFQQRIVDSKPGSGTRPSKIFLTAP